MQFKSVLFILSGLFVVQSSLMLTSAKADDIKPPPFYKEATCITSASELKIKKDSFPPFLNKTPPVMFIRDSFPVSALSFNVQNGKIVGEAVYKVLFGVKRDNGYVSKVCYEKNELTIELEVGPENQTETKKFNVKVIDDKTIEVKGFKFKQASPQEFARIMNKLGGENAGREVEPVPDAGKKLPPPPIRGKN